MNTLAYLWQHASTSNGTETHGAFEVRCDVAHRGPNRIDRSSGYRPINILGVLDSYDQGSYVLADQEIRNLTESTAARLRNRMLGLRCRD